MTVTANDSSNAHSEDKSTKLNNQLVELLEGLNDRKSRIDEQVKFLSNLPKILPFEPLPPEPSNVSRKTWEGWWLEHDRIEQEAGFFREDEFALMKKVAMSKTTNMSREDTDLVGLTLGTLEAFSKLEHLLRSRRKQLQTLDLRIKWDQQTSKVWKDLAELETQLPILLSKIRWAPPSVNVDQQHHSGIASTSPNSSPFPPPASIMTSSHPTTPTTSQSSRNPLSRSLQSRNQVDDCHQDSPRIFSLPRSSTNAERPDADLASSCHSEPSTGISLNNSSSLSGLLRQLQHDKSSSKHRNTISCVRTTSAPAYKSIFASSPTLPSSYSSAQSRAMRIQSLTLQLSSISTKFHTLNRSIVPTSTTIDKLIDSGLHVPEIFLDLQDKLEAAVRLLQPTETSKFCAALMEQHREADDIWFSLFHLGREIEASKREIDCLLTAAQIDPLRLVDCKRQFDQLSKKYEAQHLRTRLRILPTHSNYPDQPEINQLLIENLQHASRRVKTQIDRLNESVEVYKFATEALEESKVLRSSMEESKHKLSTFIKAVESLNEAHPHRPWLMNGPDCLGVNDKEKEYEIEWGKIIIEMKENFLAAANLLENANAVLKKLNAPGGDPNVRSNFCQVRDVLRDYLHRAQLISTSKEQSVLELKKVRTSWTKILETQSEVGRLRDQLVLDAHREKWRMPKVSPTSPIISNEDSHRQCIPSVQSTSPRGFPSLEQLRCPEALSANLFLSRQDAQHYVSQSLQPLVDSTLADLTRQHQHRAVHQHIMKTFDELRSVQVPQLVKLEETVELVRSQASQVRKVESEYDGKVIEGGRWMKRVQDLIDVELERTYDEADNPTGPTDSEARMIEKSRQTQTLAQLAKYLGTLDQFCNSLSNRIPFINASHSDTLALQNGRVVLHCQAHDDSVRSHLNGLSMYLMGLKDQISNESSLLEWINSPHVKKFKQAVDDVRKEIQTTDVELQTFKAEIERLNNLIESDVYEPFLSDDQIEQTLDKPLQQLTATLDEIESQLSRSASVHLEAFIASCPSSVSSGAFKPDQFIIPKQMSHHQLQSLYNQTRRELEGIHLLAGKFKNETNLRRKNEVSWRQEWAQSIDELAKECSKLDAGIVSIESESTQLAHEAVEWEQNQFKAMGSEKLAEVDDPLPEYLDDLASRESRLSESKNALATIQENVDLVVQRATAVKVDIEDRLPAFLHLTTDLFTLLDQLKCQCAKSHGVELQISLSGARLKTDVEHFMEEYKRGLDWKDHCLKITDSELQVVDQSLAAFDETFDQFTNSWHSLTEGETIDETNTVFRTLLDFSRTLNHHRTTELHMMQSHLEVARTKLSSIRQEVEDLSSNDVPHVYLSKAEAEVDNKFQELRRRFRHLEAAENKLSTLLCRVDSKQQSCLEDQLERTIISKHYDTEQARLTDWGRVNLDCFINLVQNEGQQIEHLLADHELLPPQDPTVGLLESLATSAPSISTLADIGSNMKDQVMRIEDLVKSSSDMTQRLAILGATQTQLVATIVNFEQTLPAQCSKQLEDILKRQGLEAEDGAPNRFEVASTKLDEIHSTLEVLDCALEVRLETAKENLRIIQNEMGKLNGLSSFCDRLNQLDLDRWVDVEANSQYSPLPTQDVLDQAQQVLDEAEDEIKEISTKVLDQSCLQDALDLFEDRKRKATIMSHLVVFKSKISDCDQSFSALIDTLDIRRSDTAELKIKNTTNSARAAFDALLKASESITNEPRVEYHLTRSRHTWEELESIVKENKGDQQKDLRRSTNRPGNQLSKSTRHPNLPKSRLVNDSDKRSSINSSPSFVLPRVKHSSDHYMNQPDSPTVSNSQGGFMGSPSYMNSRRHVQPSPDSCQDRSSKVLPNSQSNTATFPTRSMSRQSTVGTKGNTSSVRERHRLHSMQTTPIRPSSKLSTSRTAANSNNSPALYKPQANRNIDKLVGNVVNRLASNQLRVHVAPAEGWEDNSGMYWIGEKIYFCRILRSQTVMVRIGGGWSELSAFLMEHLRLHTTENAPQVQLRTAEGSERVVSREHRRRPSSGLASSSVLSSHGSCESSPRQTVNDGRMTDSTTSTPTSSLATVLITTPQEIRSSSTSSSIERVINLSNSTSPSSFLSTPTGTIQMFLRKADNRHHPANNYIHTAITNDTISSNITTTPTDSSFKINRPHHSPNSGSPSNNLNISTNSSKNPNLPLWRP
ncbi:hypothetical protein MJO28_010102 [Puccinia striiformis f. sp. tritici]|uniref:Uncharacterized protein n=1 Tax=Puccinia striiformis f. sp. tritici TaxID=168172 RepID=A0ACC0E3Y2_9BASI|nr:hypothetical protein MJO28_010102 [Puccinia striiformis f. sp. tritici]